MCTYLMDHIAVTDACSAFPCDPNSTGCKVLGSTHSAADRKCGPCRHGFVLQNGACIDIYLADLAHENFALGNVQGFLSSIATDLSLKLYSPPNVASMLGIFQRLANVCMR